MYRLLRYFFIGIVFPLLMQFVVYFQFTPGYTQNQFSKAKFEKFYSTSVYQSRQLGKQLHLWTYEKLSAIEKVKRFTDDPYNSKRLRYLDPDADMGFYFTYFVLACIFSVLTALTLLYLFEEKQQFGERQHFKDLAVLFITILIAITQFVITPYDNPGYFFQALAMLAFSRYIRTQKPIYYISLLLLIVIATTNRETSLLILSFMCAVYLSAYGWQMKWIKKMVIPVCCFAIPYLVLKFSGDGTPAITDVSQWRMNFEITNPWAVMGLLFAAFVIYFSIQTLDVQKHGMAGRFLLFSLPYLVLIPAVGMMLEYRLWVPVIETVMVLSLWRHIHLSKSQHSVKEADREMVSP